MKKIAPQNPASSGLYENRIYPFDINMLRRHIFVGAIVDIKLRFHELPLPGDHVFTNFMNMKLRFVNMKLRFVNMKLRFHHSLCPPEGMGVYERILQSLNLFSGSINAMNNVKSWDELKKEVDRLHGEGKKIVFTNGCFDILHAGHVRYLTQAREAGDVLVVALNSDSSVRKIKGEKRPIVPQNERAEVISSLKSVDYVTFFNEDTPLALIEYLRPDLLVKGADWREEEIAGRDQVLSWGGKIVLIPFVEGASTTSIIKKVVASYGKT
jgi:D-beta-D-heptose 7-phosphate kinase/D-beta-D-heptose 1-phosphate adenosyltransferase